MAKNKMADMLLKVKRKGVTNGIEFALSIAFLALNNIVDDYIDIEKRGQFFKDVEAEVNRLYETTMKSVPSGEIEEVAEKIVFHVDRLREKWGLDNGQGEL